jgi:hypothetical protein
MESVLLIPAKMFLFEGTVLLLKLIRQLYLKVTFLLSSATGIAASVVLRANKFSRLPWLALGDISGSHHWRKSGAAYTSPSWYPMSSVVSRGV